MVGYDFIQLVMCLDRHAMSREQKSCNLLDKNHTQLETMKDHVFNAYTKYYKINVKAGLSITTM